MPVPPLPVTPTVITAILLLWSLMLIWPAKYSISALLLGERREFSLQVQTLPLTYQLLALSVGDREEVSLEVRILGLVAIRRELTRLSLAWQKLTPYLKAQGEWEGGTPSEARPVADEDEEVSGGSDFRNLLQRVKGVLTAVRLPARYFMSHLHVREAYLRAEIGTGDAASTAMAIGSAWSWTGSGSAFAMRRIRFHVKPDLHFTPNYRRRVLQFTARGAATIHQGHMLVTGLWAAGRYVRQWWRQRQKKRNQQRHSPAVSTG